MKNIVFGCLMVFITSSYLAQTIRGKVVDVETGNPIVNAQITIDELELHTVTNQSGEFEFSKEIKPNLDIRVSSKGYETQTLKRTGDVLLIQMHPSHIEMEEVKVSVVKRYIAKPTPYSVEVKKLEDLQQFSPTNLGDALTNFRGVYNASTGNGISKPVVRGLQGIRIVSIWNGVRLENQQWGGDHGMGITDLGIGSVEIIKGPASLLYGADAIGGVVYYRDQDYVKQNSSDAYVKSQFESNSMGFSNQLGYRIAKNKIRFNVHVGYNDHADYQLPNKKYAGNSRFKDYIGKFSLGFHHKNWVMHLRYGFNYTRTGIPGHSHDSIIQLEDFQYSEQKRDQTIPAQIFQNHMISIEQKLFFYRHIWTLIAANTYNALTEYEEKFTIPGIDMGLNNLLFTLKDEWRMNEKWTLISGLQGMNQHARNSAKASESLLPNSIVYDYGVFANLLYQYRKWSIQIGGRYDLRGIETKLEHEILNKWYQGFNYAAGFAYQHKKSTYKLNLSSGFRIPHLSELSANGVHHGSLRYEIGNLNLKPERSNQLDVSYNLALEHWNFVVNPFVSSMQNFIYLNQLDTIIEGYQAFQYQQKKQVWMYGADFGVHVHPHFAHWLHYETNFSYLQMENEGTALPFVPQPRWTHVIKFAWESSKKLSFEHISLQFQYFLNQTKIAPLETSSVDYGLLNISAGLKWHIKYPISIQFGVRNLLNTHYVDHLSRLKPIGLSGPGINFNVGIKWNFEKIKK